MDFDMFPQVQAYLASTMNRACSQHLILSFNFNIKREQLELKRSELDITGNK